MECLSPLTIANPAKDSTSRKKNPMLQVPCGRCFACTQTKARGWAFRLWHHNKIQKNSWFITLTYDNPSLPINSSYTYPEFHKPDLVNFFKRLRRKNEYHHPEMGKMTYYAVAEYGGQTGRPHYHFILFNCHMNLIKKIDDLWYRTSDSTKQNMGNSKILPVDMGTISYVAGYVMKRDIYKSDDLNRIREFSIMSKNIGANYATENFRYHQENLTYLSTFQGAKISIPKYLREKIFCEKQRTQITDEVHANREEQTQLLHEELKQKGIEYPKAYAWDNRNNLAKAKLKQQSKDKF